MTDIAIERVDSYDKEIIRNALTRMFENTSFPDVRGKKLLIKPIHPLRCSEGKGDHHKSCGG